MSLSKEITKAPAAIWSTRVALFAVVLILLVLILHRFGGLPTGLLLNSLAFGFGLCALAIGLGMVAIGHIWRTGIGGGVAATFGIVLSLTVFLWPLSLISTFTALPVLNDVTTDPVHPPAYLVLSNARRDDANDAQYPGEAMARAQEKYYPAVRPILIDRSVEEAFELTRSSMARLKWKIIAKVPPKGRRKKTARLEAVDTTLILGFRDDVVVRIVGTSSRARIDIRSSSRYGRHDFGANAARIEAFTKMFRARKEATVAIAAEHEAARAAGAAKARKKSSAKKRKARRRQDRRRRKRRRRRSRTRG